MTNAVKGTAQAGGASAGVAPPVDSKPFYRWGFRFEAGQIPCKECHASGEATFRTVNYGPVRGTGVCGRCHGMGVLRPHRCPDACDLPSGVS